MVVCFHVGGRDPPAMLDESLQVVKDGAVLKWRSERDGRVSAWAFNYDMAGIDELLTDRRRTTRQDECCRRSWRSQSARCRSPGERRGYQCRAGECGCERGRMTTTPRTTSTRGARRRRVEKEEEEEEEEEEGGGGGRRARGAARSGCAGGGRVSEQDERAVDAPAAA